jgi:hypothetical protein
LKERGPRSDVTGFDERFNAAPVAAPSTGDGFDGVRNDLGLFDGKVAADRVVVKRPHGGRFDDVESS